MVRKGNVEDISLRSNNNSNNNGSKKDNIGKVVNVVKNWHIVFAFSIIIATIFFTFGRTQQNVINKLSEHEEKLNRISNKLENVPMTLEQWESFNKSVFELKGKLEEFNRKMDKYDQYFKEIWQTYKNN